METVIDHPLVSSSKPITANVCPQTLSAFQWCKCLETEGTYQCTGVALYMSMPTLVCMHACTRVTPNCRSHSLLSHSSHRLQSIWNNDHVTTHEGQFSYPKSCLAPGNGEFVFSTTCTSPCGSPLSLLVLHLTSLILPSILRIAIHTSLL